MTLKKVKLSVIVPCYNENKNIPLILDRFDKVICRHDVEVLLVDNGSTDGSEKTLNTLIPKYKFARVVKVKENQGYGFGIISGLQQANGEFIGYTHADMQTDPEDVLRALSMIEAQDDSSKCYAKGDRKGRSVVDQFFTIGMSFFETLYLKVGLWDINAQPNIFHRDFFESVKGKAPNDFSLDLYFLYMAKKQGLNIMRFDVFFPDRMHGKSSWNTGLTSKWKFIKRTFEFSFRLKKEL